MRHSLILAMLCIALVVGFGVRPSWADSGYPVYVVNESEDSVTIVVENEFYDWRVEKLVGGGRKGFLLNNSGSKLLIAPTGRMVSNRTTVQVGDRKGTIETFARQGQIDGQTCWMLKIESTL